jgi:hypothetical protein
MKEMKGEATNHAEAGFHELRPISTSTPIRDLGLSLEGTSLEPIVEELRRELGPDATSGAVK